MKPPRVGTLYTCVAPAEQVAEKITEVMVAVATIPTLVAPTKVF